jgi:regulator of protease activity HflC (stomatin/prohibitin superfamily)
MAPAEPAGPSAEQRKALAQARKAEQDAAKQVHAQEKAARHTKVKEQAQASAPAREPVFAEAPAAAPVPVAPPVPVETARVAEAPADGPVDRAIIMFSNTPGAHCTACDTIKISVAPRAKC